MAENNTNISPPVPETRSPTPRCQQGCVPSAGSMAESIPCRLQRLPAPVFCDLRPQDSRTPTPGPQSTVRVNEALFKFTTLKHHRITVFSFPLSQRTVVRLCFSFEIQFSLFLCLYFDLQFSPLFVDLIYSNRIYKTSAQFYTKPCILRRLNLSSQLFLPFPLHSHSLSFPPGNQHN